MKRSFPFLISTALLVSFVLLAGCGRKAPTPGPEAVYTSAAETVQAQLQTQGLPTTAATATPFEFKTNTPAGVPPNPIATLPPIVQPTNQQPTTAPSVPDRGDYISQSPTDDTSIPVGSPFQMTWTVRNTGTTQWTTGYQLRFYAGEKFGSPAFINLPKEVSPGEQVDLTLSLKAPASPGGYTGTWVMTNADGGNFRPLDVTIKVVPTPTKTPEPTETATSVAAPTDTGEPVFTPTSESSGG